MSPVINNVDRRGNHSAIYHLLQPASALAATDISPHVQIDDAKRSIMYVHGLQMLLLTSLLRRVQNDVTELN